MVHRELRCNTRLRRVCLPAFFFVAVVDTCLALPNGQPTPQAQKKSILQLSDQIAQDRRLIQAAASQPSSGARLAYLWAQLATDYRNAADFSHAEDAYMRSLQLLQNAPEERANYATVLDNLGNFYLIFDRPDQAEVNMKKALAIRQQLSDIPRVALSRQHLADLALVRRKLRDAEAQASEAYAVLIDAGESSRSAAAAALITLTYARCQLNNCGQGLLDADQAFSLLGAAFPPNSLPFGHAFVARGFAKWKLGENQEAEQDLLQGIELLRAYSAPGDPILRSALIGYRDFLKAMHRKPDVKRIDAEVESLIHQQCADCTVSVYGLSKAIQ
jgi:tetratricopeptide (TPR) repeat protein